jgi:hypothetical protein
MMMMLLLPGFTTNPLILSKDKVPCTLASFRTLVETVSSWMTGRQLDSLYQALFNGS